MAFRLLSILLNFCAIVLHSKEICFRTLFCSLLAFDTIMPICYERYSAASLKLNFLDKYILGKRRLAAATLLDSHLRHVA